MISGVAMISEGGTSTTLCFSKNTGDRTYSLSVIPSVFEDCTTCNDLEAAVYAFGELHKKFFMDLYFQELLEADPHYEWMKAFDGLGGDYKCFVDSVFPLTQVQYPMSSTFKIIDYSFETSCN